MLSMAFHCVRNLRSQDQLVDRKMMVESKAVAFVYGGPVGRGTKQLT